jgi:hypothetical protein
MPMNAKPWDILDPNKRTNEDIYKERMDICRKCQFIINTTKTCRKCGCFMEIKTRIDNAYCPIGKW